MIRYCLPVGVAVSTEKARPQLLTGLAYGGYPQFPHLGIAGQRVSLPRAAARQVRPPRSPDGSGPFAPPGLPLPPYEGHDLPEQAPDRPAP